MALDVGFNFRNTEGYVTDSVDDHFVAPSHSYPHVYTSPNVTAGWTSTSGITGRDRNSGLDPRFAGVHFRANNLAETFFRVDTGNVVVDVRAAIGDASFSQKHNISYNNGATLVSQNLDGNDTGGNQWRDADGPIVGSSTAWISNNVKREVTVTNDYFSLGMNGGTNTVDNASLTHLHILAPDVINTPLPIIRRREEPLVAAL